ncbi:TPA: hypothetical protein ACFBWE_001743, partial [Neisseria gonorrhoeae]
VSLDISVLQVGGVVFVEVKRDGGGLSFQTTFGVKHSDVAWVLFAGKAHATSASILNGFNNFSDGLLF